MFIDQSYAWMHLEATVGPYIVITVDTGMACHKIDRILSHFTTKSEVKAQDLGSTVIRIIKSHGGFVNVYSEVGNSI